MNSYRNSKHSDYVVSLGLTHYSSFPINHKCGIIISPINGEQMSFVQNFDI